MLIDVHAHLDFEQFDNDRDKVIEKAKAEEIFIITSALGPESIKKTVRILEKHKNIFASFGFAADEFNSKKIDETIKLIKKYKKRIVAIGEVGLDYYWVKDNEKKKLEMENFQKFISLAKELSLPLVIHSRDAEKDVIEVLKEENIKAMMHCFSGSVELANEAIKIGCIISIPTSIIYSKNKKILAEKIPIEKIVIETDAPFLSPIPKTRNVPTNVKFAAEKIAEIKKIPLENVTEITTKNAIEFFNLKF
ncbi:MAG: TatD family hydrolase [Candidatus Altiarchaeota archaeon]